jgi:hypothetical protein
MLILGVVVICYVVTAFGGEKKRVSIFIFKYVYVINILVHIFGYTCIFSYFLWMFPAGIFMF